MTEDISPLLVLGAGQRCGSTLVQRLLCSHPRVLVWGEHAGQLRSLLTVWQRLGRWTDGSGAAGRDELARNGYQGFIANVTPHRRIVDAACVSFVESLFADPARDAGRPIWGFKEVRYGLNDVLMLRELFPKLRVVQVVRDPRDVLRSLDEWERIGGWERLDTEISVRNWLTVAASFTGVDRFELSSFILPVRYEDLIRFSHRWSEAIAEHCNLDHTLLDTSVFDHRVHTAGPRGAAERNLRPWSELPDSMRALLDDEELGRVASAYGYDLG